MAQAQHCFSAHIIDDTDKTVIEGRDSLIQYVFEGGHRRPPRLVAGLARSRDLSAMVFVQAPLLVEAVPGGAAHC